jgi:hypothetical protein
LQAKERNEIEYNKDRVDEMILALLYLTSSHDKYGTRAWIGRWIGYAKKDILAIQREKPCQLF